MFVNHLVHTPVGKGALDNIIFHAPFYCTLTLRRRHEHSFGIRLVIVDTAVNVRAIVSLANEAYSIVQSISMQSLLCQQETPSNSTHTQQPTGLVSTGLLTVRGDDPVKRVDPRCDREVETGAPPAIAS